MGSPSRSEHRVPGPRLQTITRSRQSRVHDVRVPPILPLLLSISLVPQPLLFLGMAAARCPDSRGVRTMRGHEHANRKSRSTRYAHSPCTPTHTVAHVEFGGACGFWIPRTHAVPRWCRFRGRPRASTRAGTRAYVWSVLLCSTVY